MTQSTPGPSDPDGPDIHHLAKTLWKFADAPRGQADAAAPLSFIVLQECSCPD